MEDPRFASDPASAALFFRARHYHVVLRGDDARAAYEEFLRRYPEHPATDHVLYYLGLVQFSQRRDAEAAIRTLEQLFERYPGTVWGHEATYLLARAHAAANHCAAAAALYRRVIDTDGGGREDATERLRHLTCT
jgi:TolA-binding protein